MSCENCLHEEWTHYDAGEVDIWIFTIPHTAGCSVVDCNCPGFNPSDKSPVRP